MSSSLSERRQTAVFSPTFGPHGWHTKPSYAPPGGRNGADNQCSAPYFCSLRQTASIVIHEDTPILVDFQLSPGAYEVSLSPQDITQKSAEALDKAMDTIHHMARRIVATVDTLPKQPKQVEVEFGIVLNAEVGALISKVGTQATIKVKLTLE